MKVGEMKREMVNVLKESEATVTFTKKDGTERVMKCTLQTEFLPIQKPKPEGYVARKPNDEVIAVFDIEKKAFRSFRIDSVISFLSNKVAMSDVKGLING